jgi:hypothetical protein
MTAARTDIVFEAVDERECARKRILNGALATVEEVSDLFFHVGPGGMEIIGGARRRLLQSRSDAGKMGLQIFARGLRKI